MFKVLAFSWFLSVGLVPYQYEQVGKETVQDITGGNVSTVAELGLTATAFDRLDVFTTIETFQTKHPDTLYFKPYRSDYTFGLSFRLIDGLTIGASHYCNHTVLSGPVPANIYAGGETQLTVTISGGTGHARR